MQDFYLSYLNISHKMWWHRKQFVLNLVEYANNKYLCSCIIHSSWHVFTAYGMKDKKYVFTTHGMKDCTVKKKKKCNNQIEKNVQMTKC